MTLWFYDDQYPDLDLNPMCCTRCADCSLRIATCGNLSCRGLYNTVIVTDCNRPVQTDLTFQCFKFTFVDRLASAAIAITHTPVTDSCMVYFSWLSKLSSWFDVVLVLLFSRIPVVLWYCQNHMRVTQSQDIHKLCRYCGYGRLAFLTDYWRCTTKPSGKTMWCTVASRVTL